MTHSFVEFKKWLVNNPTSQIVIESGREIKRTTTVTNTLPEKLLKKLELAINWQAALRDSTSQDFSYDSLSPLRVINYWLREIKKITKAELTLMNWHYLHNQVGNKLTKIEEQTKQTKETLIQIKDQLTNFIATMKTIPSSLSVGPNSPKKFIMMSNNNSGQRLAYDGKVVYNEAILTELISKLNSLILR